MRPFLRERSAALARSSLVSSRSVVDPLSVVSSRSGWLLVARLPVGIFLEPVVCRSPGEAKGDDKKEEGERKRQDGERKKTERGVGRPEQRGQATSTLIGFYS